MFSSWHLPKVLIRKSAIRACSGASTLKDQYLGQVPGGGGKKKEGGGAPYQKNTIFWLSCWRGPREPKKSAIVLIFRTAQNLSAEGERHGTSHQLQQPIRRQRDAPPHTPYPRLHGFIHTTTTTTTYKDFARNKKAPANVKRTYQHQWSSQESHKFSCVDPRPTNGTNAIRSFL